MKPYCNKNVYKPIKKINNFKLEKEKIEYSDNVYLQWYNILYIDNDY